MNKPKEIGSADQSPMMLIARSDGQEAFWMELYKADYPELICVDQVTDENRQRINYAFCWYQEQGILSDLPNLQAIFSLGAGVDHLLRDPNLPDVPIIRFVDPSLTNRMVEYITMMTLICSRQQHIYNLQQSQAKWLELDQPCAEEYTVGVMGLGVLGSACATALANLRYNVVGWSRSQKDITNIKTYAGQDGLDAFLGKTDILICLLPLTSETTGILNASLFSKLNKIGPLGGACLINAARGGHQQEADIIQCLDEGILKLAILDVFENEPLSSENPLWQRGDVILTPHIAALSSPENHLRHVKAQIERHQKGLPFDHLVDREQGY